MKAIASRLLAFFAVAVILSACSTAASPSPSTATLDGHAYLSTDVEGAVLVPGSRIRLGFANGNLTASGGCNTMSGAYAIQGDRIVTTQMSMTEMACAEPLMAQDEWLATFLGGITYTLAGDTLTLTNGATRLTLLDKEVATPDQPIEGTRWVVDGIVSGDAVSSVPAGVTASIRISAGQLDVDTGCNTGGGPVEVTPTRLTFGSIALTKRACLAGPAAVESAVVAVLKGTVDYTIDADTLNLDAGAVGLTLRAAP